MTQTKSKHGMSSSKASKVKKGGHKKEREFNNIFGDPKAEINSSGASADCYIEKSNPRGKKLMESLEKAIGSTSNSVSLKSSKTIQIHLGNLPELTNKELYSVGKTPKGNTMVDHGISFADQKKQLTSKSFWDKYLRKGDNLIYKQADGSYVCFNMDDVIDFIVTKCIWRILPTGRLKGGFYDISTNSVKQYLTYEYRKDKKQFVLGAHGGKGDSGKGLQFIKLLKLNLKHHIEV
jgi:hypothetical protein